MNPEPPDTATTVRTEGDQLLLTDGPYAETKEVLGGFWIIKCDDLDAALGYAEKIGVVELRRELVIRRQLDVVALTHHLAPVAIGIYNRHREQAHGKSPAQRIRFVEMLKLK